MWVVIVIFFIWIIWAIIAGVVKAHKEKIRDKVAHELLDNVDLQKEEESVKNINPTLNLVVNQGKCPLCGNSLVNHRQMLYRAQQKKVYAGYLRCSNYPKCKFARQVYPINPWEKFVNSL